MSTLMVALSHLLHRMLGATTVYGIYRPTFAGSIGPLLNPNNLAGFMAMGTPLFLGLAFRAKGALRVANLLSAGVLMATGFLAGSRGGAAVLVAGPIAFIALQWLSQKRLVTRAERSPGPPSSLGRARTGALELLAVAGGTFLAAYGLAELAADDFIDSDFRNLSKLDLFGAELSILLSSSRHALLGVGRGAFGPAFVQNSAWAFRVQYAECLPLQYAVEFGLPLTALAAVAILVRFRVRFWQWRSPAQLGGLVGIAMIALQNFVDFSLELTGIAVPAAACLGACLPGRDIGSARLRVLFSVRTSAIVLLAFGICANVVAAYSAVAADTVLAERGLIEELDSPASPEAAQRLAIALRAHPADAAFASIAAARAVRNYEKSAPTWLNRAMELAPGWASPHLLAATWLFREGREVQALDELAIAAPINPTETQQILCRWLEMHPSASAVQRVSQGAGDRRLLFLDQGAACLYAAPSESDELDTILLREAPSHVGATERKAMRALEAHEWKRAIELARRIQSEAPERAVGYTLEAEALGGEQRNEEAVNVLSRAASHIDEVVAVLIPLAYAETRVGDARAMRSAIDRLRLANAGDVRAQANAMIVLGQCESSLGNDVQALKAMHEAYELGAPSEALASAAQLASKLGQLDFALRVWQQLCREHPTIDQYCKAQKELEQARQGPLAP